MDDFLVITAKCAVTSNFVHTQKEIGGGGGGVQRRDDMHEAMAR